MLQYTIKIYWYLKNVDTCSLYDNIEFTAGIYI